jgi:DNA-binding MarR family transcriptional regulator
MTTTESSQKTPKAIIHKQILESAEANPDASLDTIAEMVSGTSPDLVKRTLEKYGDPADDSLTPSETADSTAMSENTKYDSPGLAREEDRTAPQALEHSSAGDEGAVEPSESDVEEANIESTADGINEMNETHTSAENSEGTPKTEHEKADAEADNNPDSEAALIEELSQKQLRVLRAISDQPTAAQQELAEQFDVTRATISRWVNSIPGFEWQDRKEFVAQHLNTDDTASDGGVQLTDELDTQLTELQNRLDNFDQQLTSLQQQVDNLEQDRISDDEDDVSPPIEIDLVAKAIRACIDDERIAEEEETDLISLLLKLNSQ